MIEKDPTEMVSPFETLLDIRVLNIGEGTARVEMPFKREITQPSGVVHGGAITTLADTASAVALRKLVEPSKQYFTARLEIRFLSTLREGSLVAEAVVVEKKKRKATVDVKIRNKDGALIAKATAIFLIEK